MDFLPGSYDVNGATWFYLSLLLITSIYFRFNRVWSLRNLDLLLLVSLAPGLLLVRLANVGNESPTTGYIWLFVVSGLLLLRFLADGWLMRRPRIEQNLNSAGLGFLGAAAFIFLMSEVFNAGTIPKSTVETVNRASQLLERKNHSTPNTTTDESQDPAKSGPTASLFAAPAVEVSKLVNNTATAPTKDQQASDLAARLTAIAAHLAVIVALLLMGYLHFGDLRLGIGMAALYLLLPSTSYDVSKVDHVLPAALIAWAVVAFRWPVISGCLMGLACGTLVFPVFLLPLWLSFYRRQGWLRFGAAVAVVALVLAGTFAFTAADSASFTTQITASFDWNPLDVQSDRGEGFWHQGNNAYRIPVRAVFFIMLVYLVMRPRKKNLEHLLAQSAAIIVAIQFWYPRHGGEFVLWYLPLALMVVFRPRLKELLPPADSKAAEVTVARPEPGAATTPAPTFSSSSRLLR